MLEYLKETALRGPTVEVYMITTALALGAGLLCLVLRAIWPLLLCVIGLITFGLTMMYLSK